LPRLELYIAGRQVDEANVADIEAVYEKIAEWKQQYRLDLVKWEAYLVREIDLGFMQTNSKL